MEPTKHETIRDKNGRFIKGSSGNPTGKNAGRPPQEDLEEALLNAQQKHDKTFLQHFVERAFINDNVAIALAKKLLPDQIKGEGFGGATAVYSLIREIRAAKEMDKSSVELDNGYGLHKGRTRFNTSDKEIPMQKTSGDNL